MIYQGGQVNGTIVLFVCVVMPHFARCTRHFFKKRMIVDETPVQFQSKQIFDLHKSDIKMETWILKR